MTEIRRSRIGRLNVSRGRCRSSRGIMVSGGGIASLFLPSVQPRDKSFGVGVWPGRQLDETIRTGKRGEVSGAIRGLRLRPGAARIVGSDAHRHEKGERLLDRDGGGERE